MLNHLFAVMAGLVPAIHVFPARPPYAPRKRGTVGRGADVGARDNPRIKSGDGHGGEEAREDFRECHP